MASRPSASRPCFFPLPVRRSPSGARAGLVVVGLHVGGARSTHTTPQVRRQMLRHMQGGARLTACYSLLERSSSERTRRPTPARPPIGRSICFGDAGPEPAELRASAASRGCYNPRRSAARPARVGRVDRAPPALAGCGVVVWVFTPLLQPAAVVCVLVLRSRRGRDWTGFRAGSSRPPGCVSRGCSARWGYRCGSSRRRRARRSSCSSPPSSAPPPRIARRRAWPPSRRPP